MRTRKHHNAVWQLTSADAGDWEDAGVRIPDAAPAGPEAWGFPDLLEPRAPHLHSGHNNSTGNAIPWELFPQERSVRAWLERSEVVSWAKKKATGAGGGVVEQEVQGHSREREQAPCTGCMPKGTGTDRSAEAG